MFINKAKYIIVLALLISVLSNCRKYRDDNNISFKRPLKRILGNWQIDYFFVNFQDSSYHLYYSTPTQSLNYPYYLKNLQLKFGIEHTLSSGDKYWIMDGPTNFISLGNPNNRSAQGVWKPDGSIKNILIESTLEFEYRVSNETWWKILKLTDKEFHVQTIYNEKTYEIYFKKY